MLDPIRGALSHGGGAELEPHSRHEEAARQFEALLITFLLRTMREAGAEGWLGTGEDRGSAAAMEMAEAQFAEALSAQGGLGLARLVAEGLKPPK
jgi:Rod binding domain-containing protein